MAGGTIAVHRSTASIAAGGNATPLSGDPCERLTQQCFVEMSVTGGSGLLVSYTVSGRVFNVGNPVIVGTTFPTIPDQLDIVDAVYQGGQNRIFISNPTAGALSYWAYAQAGTIARSGGIR